MTELEKAIEDLKVALQNKEYRGRKTPEEVFKLLPYIKEAEHSKTVSADLLLNLVLKTRRLLDFSPQTVNKKGKKYSYVLDTNYYGSNLQHHLDAYKLEEQGIKAHRIPVEISSEYSQIHDDFEKLIDSVPGKRNGLFVGLGAYLLVFGVLIGLLGMISIYPLVAGILMMVFGLIMAVNSFVRTDFSKQMYHVSKARQQDENDLAAAQRSQFDTIFKNSYSKDSIENNRLFFMKNGPSQTHHNPGNEQIAGFGKK